MVIEAVFEQFESKREVFGELDQICGSEVILASNHFVDSHYASGCINPATRLGS